MPLERLGALPRGSSLASARHLIAWNRRCCAPKAVRCDVLYDRVNVSERARHQSGTMKAIAVVAKLATFAALVACGSGCASAAKPPSDTPARGPLATDLSPGQYELWIDQRCRREARKWSTLPKDAYVRVAEEKRFMVFRTRDRLVLRSVDGDVELEAIPHKDLPGVFAIRSASGGILTIHGGPSGKRADLVLFGTGSPYLACDRGSIRTVASL